MIGEETLTERIRAFVALIGEKRRIEAELKRVAESLEAIEGPLLEDMAGAGMKNVTIDNYTVYVQREFTCGIKPELDKQAVLQSFIDAGEGQLVMLGWSALRSMVREAEESGQALPECVASAVETGEVYKLRARKV